MGFLVWGLARPSDQLAPATNLHFLSTPPSPPFNDTDSVCVCVCNDPQTIATLCITIPLIPYNVFVFIAILKTMCVQCETCKCKCDTHSCVSVCDDSTSHWVCALVCVGPTITVHVCGSS